MEIDQFDGIQKRLQLILAGINKVRDDLDLDKEELKSNVKKIGREVNKIERSFNKSDGFYLVDVIFEEVTLIKEEMRIEREKMKVEIKKLNESVAKLDKKCRRINDDSEDLQVRLNAALDKAKLAEGQLEKERKNKIFIEDTQRMLMISTMKNDKKSCEGIQQEDDEDKRYAGAFSEFDWVNYRFRVKNLMQNLSSSAKD